MYLLAMGLWAYAMAYEPMAQHMSPCHGLWAYSMAYGPAYEPMTWPMSLWHIMAYETIARAYSMGLSL